MKNVLRLAASLGVSGLLLWLAFRTVDLSQLLDSRQAWSELCNE